jgi:uncharacterized protein YdeI (YjbR/CyaY-like superfamily)
MATKKVVAKKIAKASHEPRIDAYVADAAPFARPILAELRRRVHAALPGIEETIKWGAPAFMHGGKQLAMMAAFKQHAAFNLRGGQDIVGGQGDGPRAGMGNFGRLESVDDLPDTKTLAGWLREAAARIDAGGPKKAVAPKRPPPDVPSDLAAALAKNAAARKHFTAFSPSCQREYVEWLVEAKREETRAKRLAQALEWIAEGKHRHWKYQNG